MEKKTGPGPYPVYGQVLFRHVLLFLDKLSRCLNHRLTSLVN